MTKRIRLTQLGAAILFTVSFVAGCDFGTHAARVDERLSELQNPDNNDGYEEGEEKIPPKKLYYNAFMSFYDSKGRAPSSWPELIQYCESYGDDTQKYVFACQQLQKEGMRGNWSLAGGQSREQLRKVPVLYKKDDKPGMFGNGIAADY